MLLQLEHSTARPIESECAYIATNDVKVQDGLCPIYLCHGRHQALTIIVFVDFQKCCRVIIKTCGSSGATGTEQRQKAP